MFFLCFLLWVFSGLPALAAIEAVPTDSKDKPSEDIVLVKATVFSNPVDEMEDELEKELQIKIDEREVRSFSFFQTSQPFHYGSFLTRTRKIKK